MLLAKPIENQLLVLVSKIIIFIVAISAPIILLSWFMSIIGVFMNKISYRLIYESVCLVILNVWCYNGMIIIGVVNSIYSVGKYNIFMYILFYIPFIVSIVDILLSKRDDSLLQTNNQKVCSCLMRYVCYLVYPFANICVYIQTEERMLNTTFIDVVEILNKFPVYLLMNIVYLCFVIRMFGVFVKFRYVDILVKN
jgi:hypothetical protein